MKGVIKVSAYKDKLKAFMPALPNPHFEPIIELTSDREAVIEGSLGIIEYNDCIATINCRIFLLTFEGFNICLKTLSDDCISVTGRFTSISYTLL